MSNAFNECSCSCFHVFFIVFIYAWVQWSYHCAGELNFGFVRLQTTTGVQQGDPLGPLLSSLVILKPLDEIREILDMFSSMVP